MSSRARLLSRLIALGVCLPGCGDSTSSSSEDDRRRGPDFGVRKAVQTRVELHRQARLLQDGSLRLRVRALCPAGFQVVEGPVSVMQGPEFQEIFGEGFFTVPCDRHWHLQRVRVTSPEGFERGSAEATASLMVEHPVTGEFLQGDDREVLKIR